MLAEGDMMMVTASDGGRIISIASGTGGEVATTPLVQEAIIGLATDAAALLAHAGPNRRM
jgi:hypothetical protein